MSYNQTTCYDDICDVPAQTPAQTMTFSHFSARVSQVTGWIKCAVDVYRQRQHLAQLSACELSDLGLGRTEARIEAARPFWDLPDDVT